MSRSAAAPTRKRQARLARVLAAAGDLFAASDFRQVSMDEIARAARVGKGTLYNLFQSKEDLYLSLVRQRLGELLDILERAYDARRDTLKNLRGFILHLHRFMSRHPHFYPIWKREESGPASAERPGIAELESRLRLLVLGILEQGLAEGVFRPGLDPDLVTRVLLGMTDGLRRSRETAFRREGSIDRLLEMIVKGIGREGLEVEVDCDSSRHVRRGDEA